jgi:hypothetical protein
VLAEDVTVIRLDPVKVSMTAVHAADIARLVPKWTPSITFSVRRRIETVNPIGNAYVEFKAPDDVINALVEPRKPCTVVDQPRRQANADRLHWGRLTGFTMEPMGWPDRFRTSSRRSWW